jgi:hypothetical protein
MTKPYAGCGHSQTRARTCAKKVVARVHSRALLRVVRLLVTRGFAHALHFDQLEGLAVARPWGFESPLPHITRSGSFYGGGRLQALGLRAPRSAFGHKSPVPHQLTPTGPPTSYVRSSAILNPITSRPTSRRWQRAEQARCQPPPSAARAGPRPVADAFPLGIVQIVCPLSKRAMRSGSHGPCRWNEGCILAVSRDGYAEAHIP